jgi:hypothetical protein
MFTNDDFTNLAFVLAKWVESISRVSTTEVGATYKWRDY